MNEKERELIVSNLVSKGYEEQLVNKYFDKLEKYIMEQAKKIIKGSSGMVEDSTVFNWCEDYFHDEEYLKEPKPEVKIPKTVEEQKFVVPTGEITKPKTGKNKEAEGQISLW